MDTAFGPGEGAEERKSFIGDDNDAACSFGGSRNSRLLGAPTAVLRRSATEEWGANGSKGNFPDEYTEALLNEEAGVKAEAPKPLQPLAGVHGYEGLNYDHIYNSFQLQESIAERSQQKSIYGYSGKVRVTRGGRGRS